MESLLSELEEFVETLDLAPEEESKIARILEKLRDEATASGVTRKDSDWPATVRLFLPGWQKEKACISAGFLALGSPVDHFDSSFVQSLSLCFC